MTPLVFSFFFSSDVEDEKSIASLSFLPFSPITSFPTSSTSNALNLFSSSTCTIVPYLTDTLICLSLPLVKLSSSSLNLCTDTAPQLENTNGPTTDSFSSVCFIFFFSSKNSSSSSSSLYIQNKSKASLSLSSLSSVRAETPFEKRERTKKELSQQKAFYCVMIL